MARLRSHPFLKRAREIYNSMHAITNLPPDVILSAAKDLRGGCVLRLGDRDPSLRSG